jgi:hypothetical protein
MGQTSYTSDIGHARQYAEQQADSSGFNWVVLYFESAFDDEFKYIACPEVEVESYEKNKIVFKAKPNTHPNEDSILVTKEEKELIAAILRDDDDRQFFPGNDEMKDSLLKKILKKI